ncbi:unnamed protein product [Linum tenue]|uniref:Uncharacterized protein n=1 Tax=Linum tenue TaxID=586396 RepID=A0AAV0RXW8_9ROSI|nr:unnamed protein product [Linum tenue]
MQQRKVAPRKMGF